MENRENYYHGNWTDSKGEIHEMSYKTIWNNHLFTASEHQALLAGKEITFSVNGKDYVGHLQYKKFNGKEFFGFCPRFDPNYDTHPVYKELESKESNFPQDLKYQEIIGAYLKKYLYSEWKNTDGTNIDYFRFNHKALQDKEVDVVVRYNNVEYLIDEKAQADYIYNVKPLDTFAFELSFLNKEGLKTDGWLVKDNLLTEYFLLGWPHADRKPLDVDSIEYVDYALVDKKKLLAMIETEFHSNVEKLKYYAEQMRNSNLNCTMKTDETGKVTHYYYKTGDFNSNGYLVFTQKKTEKPINLVLKRDLIDRCTVYKGIAKRKD